MTAHPSSYHEGVRCNTRKPASDHADVSKDQAQNELMNPSAAVTHPGTMSDKPEGFAEGVASVSACPAIGLDLDAASVTGGSDTRTIDSQESRADARTRGTGAVLVTALATSARRVMIAA